MTEDEVDTILAQSEQVAFLTLDDLGTLAVDQTEVLGVAH